MTMKKSMKNENGFTLIEMVISILVGSILAAAVTPIIRSTVMSYETATTVTEAFQASRIAYNRMLSELRMIPSTASVTAISSGGITFTDRDGNSVSYSTGNYRLLRNGFMFAENVTAFTIVPRDTAGAALTPTAQDPDVWSYEVLMTVTVRTGNDPSSVEFKGQVTPRNF